MQRRERRCCAVLEASSGVPVDEAAARFGVSRQSVHGWIRRYEQGGRGGLMDRSRRPGSCPHPSVLGLLVNPDNHRLHSPAPRRTRWSYAGHHEADQFGQLPQVLVGSVSLVSAASSSGRPLRTGRARPCVSRPWPYHGHGRATRLRVLVGALSAVTLLLGYLPGIRGVGDVGALEPGSEERARLAVLSRVGQV